MAARTRMLARVTIPRAVAAKRYAALLAGAEMHPVVAERNALSALEALRMFY